MSFKVSSLSGRFCFSCVAEASSPSSSVTPDSSRRPARSSKPRWRSLKPDVPHSDKLRAGEEAISWASLYSMHSTSRLLLMGNGCKTGFSSRLIKRLPPRRPKYPVHQRQPRSWMRVVGAAIKGATPLISQGHLLINHLSQPRPCLPHHGIDLIGLPGF